MLTIPTHQKNSTRLPKIYQDNKFSPYYSLALLIPPKMLPSSSLPCLSDEVARLEGQEAHPSTVTLSVQCSLSVCCNQTKSSHPLTVYLRYQVQMFVFQRIVFKLSEDCVQTFRGLCSNFQRIVFKLSR